MHKQSMVVEGFKIAAWKDKDGLMRLEIKAENGRDVLQGLNHPWESGNRIMFVDNPAIIEAICHERDTPDCRHNPSNLRVWGKDPAFREWFMASSDGGHGSSPEEWADRIEKRRKLENRDPMTGEMLVELKPALK